MKKLLALLIPLAFVFGCDDDDSEQVQPDQCFVSEAIVTFPSADVPTAETKEKYITSYADTYSMVSIYETDDAGNFQSSPARTITMTFDETDNTKILEILYNSSDPTTYTREEYSYLNDMDILKQITEVVGGETAFERSLTIHVPPPNPNGMYILRNIINEDVLYVFENNNLTKIGQLAEEGDITFDGRSWRITRMYEYDNNPNAAKDILIAMLTFGIDSPIRFSKNNVIREINVLANDTTTLHNAATYTQDGKVATYNLESVQRNITFEYDCLQ